MNRRIRRAAAVAACFAAAATAGMFASPTVGAGELCAEAWLWHNNGKIPAGDCWTFGSGGEDCVGGNWRVGSEGAGYNVCVPTVP